MCKVIKQRLTSGGEQHRLRVMTIVVLLWWRCRADDWNNYLVANGIPEQRPLRHTLSEVERPGAVGGACREAGSEVACDGSFAAARVR